ncbi:hypothetical protein Ancab_013051 [Ancistrocladus abbreviatus]
MENTSVSVSMGDQKDAESLNGLNKGTKSAEVNMLHISEYNAHKFLGGKPGKRLILNFKQLETHENLVQEIFRKSLGSRIPKCLMTLDEKYLRHCLEVIRISASKANPCGISLNPLDMGFILDSSSSSETVRKESAEIYKFVTDCPMAVGTENIAMNPVGRWMVGSVMRSNGMMNILKRPLFQQTGDLDNERSINSDLVGSLSGSTVNLPQKHCKEMLPLSNHGDKSDTTQSSPAFVSSSPPTFTDQFTASSSSFTPTSSQGMFQCVWNGGVPHFIFSVDHQRGFYVANAWKVDLPSNKALDFVYSFHWKPYGQKDYDNTAVASDMVGKMRVSTSFSLCPNNSKVRETEFVLFSMNENHVGEIQTSIRTGGKSKTLSKVIDVLKAGHPVKQRRPSKFSSTSVSCEIFPSGKAQDACSSIELVGGAGLLQSELPPNVELAAIIVKDHLHEGGIHDEEEVGGWGLKFLKKAGAQKNSTSLKTSACSECCQQNAGDFSTSMDIIVPAGVHGGPRTRNSGPSTLVERWRSGGQCDCGGWDVGCPLTVLRPRLRKDSSMHPELQADCKSFDIYTQGSKQGIPTMKMVNIHDDLYFINFQSNPFGPAVFFNRSNNSSLSIPHSST